MELLSRSIRKIGPMGGYQFARQICRNQPRILMYHRFSDSPVKGWASSECFEQQVRHIRERYNPYSLVGLMKYHREHGRMPPHAVVITVDDGYRDFYEHAFPILQRHGVPATLFATTGFIDRRLWLWPDKITWILDQLSHVSREFTIGSFKVSEGALNGESRSELWKRLIAHALSLPDEVKHEFISGLACALGLVFPDEIPESFAPLCWNELKRMQEAHIEIGGHTVTHPSLGRVTEAQARDEIFGCRDALNQHLGQQDRTFCYPNGQPSDFQPFLPDLVREAGFLGAVTAFPDAQGISDRYLMRRHASGDNMFQFHKAVSGFELLGHRVKGDRKFELEFSPT
ncbi:Polysaccharide deacetylase [Marinobacter sp. es.048]|uniref:polysaccharide deacetylase family protein n=1 Tax=Marinobacter sp. es.048 TaxID=1761795 RepID=UPI000B58C9CE|nr:polysaccharide deacetylase family protein [Marinobacter sp. es.048]SNC68270.1 Polysaccharide deacetylase [Marinobacter sp. es.048]SNC74355.1 Polysaccharide deacetylase [Marinobacter sp. es.048]